MPHLSNDELPIAHSPQRVSGMKVPDGLPLPVEPNLEIETSKDAWRQTGFLMKKEWNLIQLSLNILFLWILNLKTLVLTFMSKQRVMMMLKLLSGII